MQQADELTVVHHDDSVSRFRNVTYTLDRSGLRLVVAGGGELHIGRHEMLTTHAKKGPRSL